MMLVSIRYEQHLDRWVLERVSTYVDIDGSRECAKLLSGKFSHEVK